MRKMILSLAAAGAVLIAASPAAAQYYRQPQPAPYAYGHNGYNGYGQGNFGMVRSLQVRLTNVERQIDRLDRRDRIGGRSAGRLRDEANKIEHKLRDRGRNGLDPREASDISIRIQRLEQRVQYAMNDGIGRYDRW